MDTLFYSPNGTSWKLQGPEVEIDPRNIMTMPVREYTHQDVHYTVLACIDVHIPRGIFYTLEVRRPKGVNFPENPEGDFKIMKKLLNYFPITQKRYEIVEEKLMTKLVDVQLDAYFDKMKVECRMSAVNHKPGQCVSKCLTGRYGHPCSISYAPNVWTTMFHKNALEGWNMEDGYQIRKLVQSVNSLIRTFTIPVNSPQYMYTKQTGIPSAVPHDDIITTKGWLQLQYAENIVHDTPCAGKKVVPVTDDTTMMIVNHTETRYFNASAYGDDMKIMLDGNSMTSVNQPEPEHVDMDLAVNNMKTIIDDADEDVGGIMGVFCRSCIHGDYIGAVSNVERNIG